MNDHNCDCPVCSANGVPVQLVIDGEALPGYRIAHLGNNRWIVTDNPLTGDRFFAQFRSWDRAYIVESEGPRDLQTF